MKDFFDILKELIPLWLTLITLGFGYLIYLYTKIFRQTNDLAEKQSQYLKDRIDVIDKTTSIFEKTFLQQEKSIEQLNEENKKLKKDLDESLKKFQDTIELSKKIEEQKVEVKHYVENSYIEKKLKELFIIYQDIKAMVILSETVSDKIVLSVLNEFRNSFDHIMRSFSEKSDIDKEFQNARDHLIRAGFDAAEVIVLNKFEVCVNLLQNFDVKTISKVFPEYFTEIKPVLKRIQSDIAQIRYKRETISFDEQFLNFERNIKELFDIEDKINLMIPILSKEKKKKFRLFK